MAWAAGLQVRKKEMAVGFDRLAFVSFRLSQPRAPKHNQTPHPKIHIWHLQSQPEFKEHFPDVRDPEEREKN